MINRPSTSHFSVLSLSYEKANAQVRGRFAFFSDHIEQFTEQLRKRNMGDAFVVSTCNRTEIYTTTHNYMMVAQLFCNTIGVGLMDFIQHVTVKNGHQAVEHFFRVASGLDSQILGDFEIIYQIKTWYARFKQHRRLNPYLERLFHTAIQVSKKVKSQTGISSGAASVSYAAVQFILDHQVLISAEKQVCSFHKKELNILLLGLGEIGQNTIDNLQKHLPKAHLKLCNRTEEKAMVIAKKFGLQYIGWDLLLQEIDRSDILIVATGAPEPIILKENIPTDRPMMIMDLSIPNNVEPSVREIPKVEMVNVDDLSQLVQKNIDQRKKEIPKALNIIAQYSQDFFEWEQKRQFAPHIEGFKNLLEDIEYQQYRKIKRKNPHFEPDGLSEKLIQKMTNRFARYLMDNPRKMEGISQVVQEILKPKER